MAFYLNSCSGADDRDEITPLNTPKGSIGGQDAPPLPDLSEGERRNVPKNGFFK